MSSNYAPQSIPTRVNECWIRPNPSSVMTYISTVDPVIQNEATQQAEQPAQNVADSTDQSHWS
ncbi:MAG: hypothetical protein B9S32_13365 [Verrucomicrobia bacterium Tous-C9LFEB]|nr:MAG: hypothetical protein B9S32_13365 [Verrucomicrobia bacterium Tous-C9LFEB]